MRVAFLLLFVAAPAVAGQRDCDILAGYEWIPADVRLSAFVAAAKEGEDPRCPTPEKASAMRDAYEAELKSSGRAFAERNLTARFCAALLERTQPLEDGPDVLSSCAPVFRRCSGAVRATAHFKADVRTALVLSSCADSYCADLGGVRACKTHPATAIDKQVAGLSELVDAILRRELAPDAAAAVKAAFAKSSAWLWAEPKRRDEPEPAPPAHERELLKKNALEDEQKADAPAVPLCVDESCLDDAAELSKRYGRFRWVPEARRPELVRVLLDESCKQVPTTCDRAKPKR